MRKFFKGFLIILLAVINTLLAIVSLFGFVCFIANLTCGDPDPIFKSFMLGFCFLFLAIVVHGCILLLWERWVI